MIAELSPRRPPILLAASVLLVMAGCRGPAPMEEPLPRLHTMYEEAAGGSADVAGTYRFLRVDTRTRPAAVSIVRGCRIYIQDGTMDLIVDGRYRLALSLQRVCGERGEDMEIVKEGLYSVVGMNVLFGDRMVLTTDELAPETTSGPQEIVEALFPRGRFTANGSLRVNQLSATLDDLRTYYFYREPPAGAAG